MTKYFEVLRRDGPARMGRLLLERQISTPAIISRDDYATSGSIYGYGSIEAAMSAAERLRGARLLIAPYAPGARPFKLPEMEIDGPKGIVLHPFSEEWPQEADVYILGTAGALKSPRDLVNSVLCARKIIHPDAALYAPALATPANLGLLIYLGIDLVDTIRVVADAYFGRYHTRDGTFCFSDLRELPCKCEHCKELEDRCDVEQLAGHNVLKLEEELAAVREMIFSECIREHVEQLVCVSPGLTAALRLLDEEHNYLESRTPQHRHSTLYANTAHSQKRVEITRFADRVLNRYTAPRSDVLLLLPCSARKPYSTSRSHRLFAQALGPYRRYLHELILTSPLALVPRELEEVYPAANYDVPVTGHWDLEERAWLLRCLDAYLERNRYARIVAHLEGELEEIVKDHEIDAAYTGGGTNDVALARLSEAVREACRGAARLEDHRVQRYRATADYYFGKNASKTLLAGSVKIRGREIQDERGRALAMTTPNGMLALSIEGARRLEPLERYIVTIGDFVPKGSLLAPGVVDADQQIRPGDWVIVAGERAFGVGRARMAGWEMVESRRGMAVELRHVQNI